MKVNQFIKITDAKPMFGQTYKNGDIMKIARVWERENGVYATSEDGDLYELFDNEFEVIDETAPAPAADVVNNPNHYNTGRFETIELIEEVTSGYEDGYLAYCIGNSLKYISRAPFKHETPLEDLRKAAKYLEFAIAAIERSEGKAA